MLETVDGESPVRRASSARLATPRASSESTTRSRLSSRSEPTEPDSSPSIAGDPHLRQGVCQGLVQSTTQIGVSMSDARTNGAGGVRPLGGVPEALRLGEALQLLQGAVLDLADSLAGHSEGAAHLFQRSGLVALQAVAHLDHLALPGRQRFERSAHVLAPEVLGGELER